MRKLEGSQCVICRTDRLRDGVTTTTLERDEVTIVFKGVPALICQRCGEAYFDGEVVDRLRGQFEAACGGGTIVAVRRWHPEAEHG